MRKAVETIVLVVEHGNPGDMIFKPREQWHTFWNADDAPARGLEIISPAGFENYFRELGPALMTALLIRNRSGRRCEVS